MASSIIATSVDRQSQWWSDLDTWKSHANPIASPRITPYWDFLLAAASSKSDFLTLSGLGLYSDRYRTAGAGATCIVQIGKTSRGKLVAVKVDRAASQPLQRTAPGQYEQTLSQLAKELRLLSNEKLRQDPYIIDLLGFGIESLGGSISCFLVTEYCEVRSRFPDSPKPFCSDHLDHFEKIKASRIVFHPSKYFRTFHRSSSSLD